MSRTGSGLDTEYATSVNPKDKLIDEVSTAYGNTKINLEALYDGKDPFAKE